MSEYTIKVYLTDSAGGFSYTVSTMDQVLEHVGAIVATGYRRVDERGQLVWYGPHRISSVKASGPGLETQYPDTPFRT